MKIKVMVLALFLMLAGTPAFGQDCKVEIAAVHKLMMDSQASMADSDLIRVEGLIGAATNLCEAGDENGALQKLSEARAILQGS